MYWVSVFTGDRRVCRRRRGGAGHVDRRRLRRPGLGRAARDRAIFVVTLVNLRGARSAGELQVVTTLIKLLPLIAVMLVLVFRVGSGGAPAEPLAPVANRRQLDRRRARAHPVLADRLRSRGRAGRKTRDPERDRSAGDHLAEPAFTALIYFLSCTAAVLLSCRCVSGRIERAPFADAIAPDAGAGSRTRLSQR